jgi:TfoX/Sxy family transcriptional regulator of competence genes
MAIDEGLRSDLRAHLAGVDGVDDIDGVVEKSMFGGVGFMWRGNLLCGVMGAELLVRVAKEESEACVGEDGAHVMVMGSRTARGWIVVPMPAADRPALLRRWVGRAREYVATLPAK